MIESENNNKLNLDLEYINCSTNALIREYLARKVNFFANHLKNYFKYSYLKTSIKSKGLRKTLETFDEENSKTELSSNISSRSKLIEYLNIQNIYEKNKELKTPFKTVLELLISYHSASLKNQSVQSKKIEPMEKNKQNDKSSILSSFSANTSKKINSSDLKIDDADDGELLDGNDKRINSKNIEKEKYDFKRNGSNLTSKKNLKTSSSFSKEKNTSKEEEEFESKLEKNINDLKKPSFLSSNDEEFEKKLEEKSKKPKELNNFEDVINPTNNSLKKSSKQDEPFNFKNFLSNPDSQKKTKSLSNSSQNLSLNSNNQSNEFTSQPIDYNTAKDIRTLLFGNLTQSFNDDWNIQNLGFCDLAKLKFGIVQKKGGPCGVLAAIQSYIMLELIFLNNDEPPKDLNLIFNPTKKDRSRALAKALSKLIWKCSNGNEAIVTCPSSKAYFAPVGKYRSDGFTETLTLLRFNSYQNMENYLIKNINMFENEGNSGCLMLLYSAIFTRTIPKIIKDMDNQTNKLMGMHGYCTMEMVNLLIHGRAVSNVFNDSVFLDELELRGPNKRNDIGLLSLFEHYKSCEVGSYYKTPRYPIWVVCSESHFSVLFSLRKDILSDWKAESIFDLYYYDGLAKQDEQIKLTISSKQYPETKISFFDEIYKNKKVDKEKELTPPLELVIRTKWKDASVNWNSTEPLL